MSNMAVTPVNDFNIHVSFRLVNDNTYNTQKKYIEQILSTHFNDAFSLEHEDPRELSDREVIFKIQKPVIDAPEKQKEFFVSLHEIFTTTQRYLPSFTQGLELSK